MPSNLSRTARGALRALLASASVLLASVSVLVCGLLLAPAPALATSGPPETPNTEICQPFWLQPGRVLLCGSVNPNASAEVAYYFIYREGPTCAGGFEVSPGEAEGEDVKVQGELNSAQLAPATEYTYCLVASNSFGETSGEGVTFSTAGPEAPISEACGVPAGSRSALLCGTLNPRHPEPNRYFFEYAAGPSCAGARTPESEEIETQAVKVSTEVTGLKPGAEYTFCLVAKDFSGITYGGAVTFTTALEDDSLTTVAQPQAPATGDSQTPLLVPALAPASAALASTSAGAGTSITSHPKVLTRTQELARALKACKQRARSQQAECMRRARRHYGAAKRSNRRAK